MTDRAYRLVAPALLVATILAGCGDSSNPGTAASSAPAPDVIASLDGRTFLSTEVVGTTLVEGTRIIVQVRRSPADGLPWLSLTAGCNELAAPFSVDGGRLVIDVLSTTEIGCAPALYAQDELLGDVLISRPTIDLDGDTLVIADDTVTVTLLDQEVADPDRPLVGTTWIIDTVITEQTESTTPAVATLAFTDDLVTVDTGCNTGSASATISDGSITFAGLALTERACSAQLMEFEAHIIETLDGQRSVEITADHLVLLDPASGTGLGASAG